MNGGSSFEGRWSKGKVFTQKKRIYFWKIEGSNPNDGLEGLFSKYSLWIECDYSYKIFMSGDILLKMMSFGIGKIFQD